MRQTFSKLAWLICAAICFAMLFGCNSLGQIDNAAHENERVFENIDDVPDPNEVLAANRKRQIEEEVENRISSMSLSDKVSALFIVWPEALHQSGVVTDASDEIIQMLDEYPVSGICWLQVNLRDAGQTSSMLHGISEAYAMQNDGLMIFQAIDEEGGTVERIAGNPGFDVPPGPDIQHVGEDGDTGTAYKIGANIASYLSPLGFNVDFGIIGDMTSDPFDAMYLRSFGDDAGTVSEMVASEARGMLDGGIIPCVKHYPGLGGAVGGDTHDGAVTNAISEEELVSYNSAPFFAAMKTGAPMIMTGHVTCLDVDPDQPATLSNKIVTGILRNRLGFDGIVITDAIQMRSISDQYGDEEASVRAIEAGCDIILSPQSLPAAHKGVMDAIASGRLTEQRIEESLRRILTVKAEFQTLDS